MFGELKVRRTVRSVFGEQTFAQLRTGLTGGVFGGKGWGRGVHAPLSVQHPVTAAVSLTGRVFGGYMRPSQSGIPRCCESNGSSVWGVHAPLSVRHPPLL